MLEYEWGANPSQIILTTTDDATPDTTDPHHHLVDHYSSTPHHHHQHQSFDPTVNPTTNHIFSSPTTFSPFTTPSHQQHSPNVHSMFDPRGCGYGVTSYPHPPNPYSLDSFTSTASTNAGSSSHGFLIIPKTEELGRAMDFTARLGLNLGGRTYFSSSEDDFVNRLYRRSRPADSGSMNVPRCQAEGCNADLTHAKHYHRRHKVCEFHSKAAAVIAAGLTQRFCQQCSRFHLLSEFDNGKRSCRKRLADHNRRRRKSHQLHQEIQIQPQLENAGNNNITSSYNLPKSPAESGTQSASSVTIAVSPPGMSLDSFRQRPHHQTTASSASSCSLFFSSGS